MIIQKKEMYKISVKEKALLSLNKL